MTLAIDPDEHFIEVPAPVAKLPYPINSLPPDVGCKQRPEPVLPQLHRLVTDIDPALEQQILDIAQPQRGTGRTSLPPTGLPQATS